MARWHVAGLLLLVVLFACFIRLGLWQSQAIVDEGVHVPQVTSFMSGNWETNPFLAMIPGYHVVMAGLMNAGGLSSIGAMRGVSAMFGLLAALVFYAIRRKLGDEDALVSAALFFVFPLFYPYYFLVYTDIAGRQPALDDGGMAHTVLADYLRRTDHAVHAVAASFG